MKFQIRAENKDMHIPTLLVTQIRDALLALPDEALSESVEQWLLPLYEQCDDLECICKAYEGLGYHARSSLTGHLYGSFWEWSEAEPEASDFDWVAPEMQTLREHLQVMQSDQFYYQVVILAGEALSLKSFTRHWGRVPGYSNTGDAFLRALLGYLTLRRETAPLSVEQFERQYQKQLDVLVIPELVIEENISQEIAGDEPSTGRQWHVRIEFLTTNEERQRLALGRLRQYGVQFDETCDGSVKEGVLSYRPWNKDDLRALNRTRRLLRRWQEREQLVWSERKTRPPRRTVSRHKQKQQ